MRRMFKSLLAALLVGVAAQAAAAQELASKPSEPAAAKEAPAAEAEGAKAEAKADPAEPKKQGSECKICRWFELQTAAISYRHRYVTSSSELQSDGTVEPAKVAAKQTQHRELFKGRFKFDAEGKYTVNFMASTGYTWPGTFVGGGWGFGSSNADRNSTEIFLRHLYFEAKPVKGLEVQYGSMPVAKGQNTEITSYDDDGYIMGGRVIVKRPRQLFFDEVSATVAYLGDYNLPNFFKRAHRFNNANYYQLLVSKKLGERAVVSADWTAHNGWDVMREAVKVNTKESWALDSVRFETYQRITELGSLPGFEEGSPRAWGFALTGEKTLFKRLTLGGGYASVDDNYGNTGGVLKRSYSNHGRQWRYDLENTGTLNGDKVHRGNHLLFSADYKISPELSVSAFMVRGVNNDPYRSIDRNNSVFIGVNYNLLSTLKRTGLF